MLFFHETYLNNTIKLLINAQVQEALDKLQTQQKRTTLTVAHRLTTIRNSDKIAVLNILNQELFPALKAENEILA